MKKFIKRVCLFSSVLLLYSVLILTINLIIIKTRPPIISKSIVVAGDSHLKYALNPEVLTESINICQTAEPIFITFYKLKKILKYNKINTIVLGLSYHNISNYNDSKLSSEKWSKEMFRRYITIIPPSQLVNNTVNYQSYLSVFIRELLIIPHWNHFNYIGNYTDVRGQLAEEENDLSIFYENISNNQLNYLDSIIYLSKKSGINIFLVNTPIKDYYRKAVPIKFVKALNEKINSIESKSIVYLDYTNLISDESLFYNQSHVNNKGAYFISNLFLEQLQISRNSDSCLNGSTEVIDICMK